MEIIRIISEWKRKISRDKAPKPGHKRVEAVVNEDGYVHTKHIDIPKGKEENNG